jgi:hypothetical protein
MGQRGIALKRALDAIDAVTEGDQPLHDIIVQLARQASALGLLRRSKRGDRGVHSTVKLLDMLAQHVDGPAKVFNLTRTVDRRAQQGEVALRHGFGSALQRADRLAVAIMGVPPSPSCSCAVHGLPAVPRSSPSLIMPRCRATVTASVREATSSFAYVLAR